MPQQLNCSPLNNKNKNKMAQNVPGAKVTMEALFVERQIIKHIQIRVEFQRILQLCDRVPRLPRDVEALARSNSCSWTCLASDPRAQN